MSLKNVFGREIIGLLIEKYLNVFKWISHDENIL